MDQLIIEYHILREVLCDFFEEEEPLTEIELEVIVCSIGHEDQQKMEEKEIEKAKLH
jgi:hypothetical protein